MFAFSLSSILRRSLLMVLAIASLSYGQSKDIDDEILVYILPDSLEFTEEVDELSDLKKVKIKSKSLEKAIKKIELKKIKSFSIV